MKSSTFKFSPDHLLFGRLRPYLNKVMLPEFVGHCSTEIIPLKPHPELSRQFLQYWFLMDRTVDAIDATSTGTRMPRANISAVLELDFPFAPAPVQERIVGILDEAFEGIAAVKANADRSLQNARAIFESHLQSVFSQSGDGWVEKHLDDVARDFGRGKSKHRPRNDPKLYGGAYPFVQTGDVRNSRHLIEVYSQTYNDVGLAQSKLWPASELSASPLRPTLQRPAFWLSMPASPTA